MWSPSVALIGHCCTWRTCDGVKVGVGVVVTQSNAEGLVLGGGVVMWSPSVALIGHCYTCGTCDGGLGGNGGCGHPVWHR